MSNPNDPPTVEVEDILDTWGEIDGGDEVVIVEVELSDLD